MQVAYRLFIALVIAMVCSYALPAAAAESYDNCTGFIDSVPATISTQGTWCLRKDLSTGMASGQAITIAANNVTVDCNGYKLGGLAAGAGTAAQGILADDRLNVTVRHCNIRGFLYGLLLEVGGGHLVEDNRLDGNTYVGIWVSGDGSVVRRNFVRDTGGSTYFMTGTAYGISTGHSVDVLDNTVAGVMPTGQNATAYGIEAWVNPDGSINGNRVRGLVPTGTGTTLGISTPASGRISIVGNQLVGWGVANSVGLGCENGFARAKDNNINGFATGVQGCSDDGNVIVP